MAADAERKSSEAMASSPASAASPPLVLDKDGKPCRSCISKSQFSAWASKAKGIAIPFPTTPAPAAAATATERSPPAAPTSTTTTTEDCPADVETLGRSTWTFLHTVAATYPKSPTEEQQNDLASFIRLFSRLYPCWVCAIDFQAYIARSAPAVGSRADFGDWLCRAHNDVNRKLGKPEFDCSRWEERWRTGPPDGRCD